jgi:RNA-binding protein 5/10
MLQCNEPRADDAPPADIALSNPPSLGKKGFEAGWFEMLLFS